MSPTAVRQSIRVSSASFFALATLAALVAMTFIAPPRIARAAAEPAGEAKKAIQAIYNKMIAANLKGDFTTSGRYFADDFQGTAGTYTITKAQALAAQKQSQAMAKAMNAKINKATMTIQKIALGTGGNTATCTVRNSVVTQISNPQQPGAKPVTVNAVITAQDTWKKTPKGWLLSRQKLVNQEMLMNGKRIQMPTPSAPTPGAPNSPGAPKKP